MNVFMTVKNIHSDLSFLLKISTLFFVLGLAFINPKFTENDKKPQNLSLIERDNTNTNVNHLIKTIRYFK
jgi:hypothetical protein